MSRARQSENALRYDAHASFTAQPVTVEEAARWQLPIQPMDEANDAKARDLVERRLTIALGLFALVVFAAQLARAAL